MGIWGGRRKKRREGEGSLNDERQTSFRFLPPLLVKRPILSVGWNLSDFSPPPPPASSPSGACRMSLSPLAAICLCFFLLWCSCCAGVGVVTPGGEPRLEVKAGVSPGCEGQSWKKKKEKKGASVLFNSASCDGRSVSTPPLPLPRCPTRSSSRRSSRSAVIQL